MKPVSSVNSLSVTFNSFLDSSANVSRAVSSCFYVLSSIRSVSSFLTVSAARHLVSSLVLLCIDYFISSLWGVASSSLNSLQKIVHVDARLIFSSLLYSCTNAGRTPIASDSRKDQITTWHTSKTTVIKVLPTSDTLQEVNAIPCCRHIRFTKSGKLNVSFVRRLTFERSLNDIPSDVRKFTQLSLFKRCTTLFLLEKKFR